jgi:hypothetical protein
LTAKTDHHMSTVKKEISENANLLLLHKGLVRHLKQLQIDRHPVLSKTKNVYKLQKKYENYTNSIDDLRDTAGKLKLQSIKLRDGIAKWKHQQKISTNLLDEIINMNISDVLEDDDCIQASSSASIKEMHYYSDEEWEDIEGPTIHPSPEHKCRFVHHVLKSPLKPHFPICPIQDPKYVPNRRSVVQSGNEIPMETPVINENNLLSKKLSELQNTKQHYLNRQQSIEEKITHLRREHRSLIRQDAHYETIDSVEKELSSLISKGAWIQKELVCLTTKMDDIRKRQGFTKIARAFMATISAYDPFHVTTSVIHQNASEEPVNAVLRQEAATGTADDLFDDFLYENTELKEDNVKLQTATAQLQEELDKVKAELTQIYLTLNDTADQTPRAVVPPNDTTTKKITASANEVQDLLALINTPSKHQDVFDKVDNANEATQQAKLAKELIKLATSYKIPELTFDVQASKRCFNFSTWFSKLQMILSMFPQTASIIQDDGNIMFYSNSNDFGNKASFLLIGAKVDTYFQRAIRHFSGQGDKALAFIKSHVLMCRTRIKRTFITSLQRCESKKTNLPRLLYIVLFLRRPNLSQQVTITLKASWSVSF